MNRLLSLLAATAVTALAAYGARALMQQSSERRRALSGPHPALDTWEAEGGNLAPHETQRHAGSHATRPLQQQLG